MASSSTLGTFDRLGYDVRVIIYAHMDLPPLGNGKEFSGLWLSCRLAKTEMEEAASKAARRYLEHIQETSEADMGVPMTIPTLKPLPPLKNLRTVSVGLPITAIVEGRHWVQLFTKNFAKMAVVFQGPLPPTPAMSSFRSRRGRMRLLTRELGKYINFAFARPLAYPEMMRWRLWNTRPMPKRMSIAWDLRPPHSHGTPVTLRGGGFGDSPELQGAKLASGLTTTPYFYWLVSEDRRVLEVGVISEARGSDTSINLFEFREGYEEALQHPLLRGRIEEAPFIVDKENSCTSTNIGGLVKRGPTHRFP